jgi:hypothetical protein
MSTAKGDGINTCLIVVRISELHGNQRCIGPLSATAIDSYVFRANCSVEPAPQD